MRADVDAEGIDMGPDEFAGDDGARFKPADVDVDAARVALLRILPGPDQHGNGIAWRQRLDTFETAVRAAALDEARAAVEDIRPVWLSGPDDKSVNLGQVLAAIDALREGADKK